MRKDKSRRVILIAKERLFDEERWKRLLTAFAYVIHERRQAAREPSNEPAGTGGQP